MQLQKKDAQILIKVQSVCCPAHHTTCYSIAATHFIEAQASSSMHQSHLLLHGNKNIENDIEKVLVMGMIRLCRRRRDSLSKHKVECGFCV